MAKDTLALVLKGDVTLAEFAGAMGHFSGLIKALSSEIAGLVEIEWEIANLEAGSATAVVRGTSTDMKAVERVVGGYGVVIKALESGEPIPYSDEVVRPARAITEVINSRIKSIEFRTEEHTTIVTSPVIEDQELGKRYSFGTVTGIIETLSSRRVLRFMLYDILFDKAVTCHLEEGQKEMIRNMWGKYVTVTGQIYRDPITGRPLEMRKVEGVEIPQDEPPGSYKRARGAIPWKDGTKLSEQIIRELRDD